MSNLHLERERIYKRHVDALHAVSAGSTWIDAGAAHMALYLALEELAQMQSDAGTTTPAALRDAELQLLQLNEWLVENAPEHCQQPGTTAETVLAVLGAMGNSLTLKAADYAQLAQRLHTADADCVRLAAEVTEKSRRVADLMAALEEANVADSDIAPDAVFSIAPQSSEPVLPANGHNTVAEIVETPKEETRQRRSFQYSGTDEQLKAEAITVIRNLAEMKGIAPSQRDFDEVSPQYGLPTAGVVIYRLHLTSWGKLVKLAGLTPQRSFAEKAASAKGGTSEPGRANFR